MGGLYILSLIFNTLVWFTLRAKLSFYNFYLKLRILIIDGHVFIKRLRKHTTTNGHGQNNTLLVLAIGGFKII